MDTGTDTVRRGRKRVCIIRSVISAAKNYDGIVRVLGDTNVHFRDHRRRPAFTHFRVVRLPHQARCVLVCYVERVIRVSAPAHTEDQVDKIRAIDDTVLVGILDDRHDIAIEAVLLVLRVRIEIQPSQVRE